SASSFLSSSSSAVMAECFCTADFLFFSSFYGENSVLVSWSISVQGKVEKGACSFLIGQFLVWCFRVQRVDNLRRVRCVCRVSVSIKIGGGETARVLVQILIFSNECGSVNRGGRNWKGLIADWLQGENRCCTMLRAHPVLCGKDVSPGGTFRLYGVIN
ncbi:unnamed protein product, partial [Ectocarpus sp. 13 AM-2016]